MARNNKRRSITASSRSEPFYLQVARDVIDGHYTINANGYNSAASTTKEGTWPLSAITNWPATASVMNVASSAAADDAASTGARTIRIWGLDSNWDRATEDVIMDGTTVVATTTSFIRINSVKVLTFGSGDTNAGIISVFTGAETAGVIFNLSFNLQTQARFEEALVLQRRHLEIVEKIQGRVSKTRLAG